MAMNPELGAHEHAGHFQSLGLDAADIAWVLISTALVLLMTPGVAFFYGGLVRGKNALSVLLQVFVTLCMVTLLWAVVGYSFAFAPAMWGGFIGDFEFALLRHLEVVSTGQFQANSALHFIFMAAFAIIAPAIIVGGFAERMKLSAYLWFVPLWTLLAFCPVAKWVWGNDAGATGFFALGNAGALDFAGGTVIHINAGVAALVAALVIGRRRGTPGELSQPHNIPYCALGGALVWFGWFGFNAGSAGTPNEIALSAFIATQFAAASGGLVWMFIELFVERRPTALGVLTGVITGLVAITPAAGYVTPMAAIAIGAGGPVFSYVAVRFVKRRFAYDDSLDAFGIHGVAGIWGAVGTGLFASLEVNQGGANGLFYGNPEQLIPQLRAVLYVVVWSSAVTFAVMKLLDRTVGVRASAENEVLGLDLAEQSVRAYGDGQASPNKN